MPLATGLPKLDLVGIVMTKGAMMTRMTRMTRKMGNR